MKAAVRRKRKKCKKKVDFHLKRDYVAEVCLFICLIIIVIFL